MLKELDEVALEKKQSLDFQESDSKMSKIFKWKEIIMRVETNRIQQNKQSLWMKPKMMRFGLKSGLKTLREKLTVVTSAWMKITAAAALKKSSETIWVKDGNSKKKHRDKFQSWSVITTQVIVNSSFNWPTSKWGSKPERQHIQEQEIWKTSEADISCNWENSNLQSKRKIRKNIRNVRSKFHQVRLKGFNKDLRNLSHRNANRKTWSMLTSLIN